jgi:hypothetical protein
LFSDIGRLPVDSMRLLRLVRRRRRTDAQPDTDFSPIPP